MLHPISTVLFALAILLPMPLSSQEAEKTVPGNSEITEDWESLIAETEAFLSFSEDPKDRTLDLDTFTLWSTSLAVGPGYSSNFLKRKNPTSSRFMKLESDLFFSALMEKSSLIALLYVEGIQYEYDSEEDHEAMALLHTNWTRFNTFGDFGAELDLFLGDQIYDASLSSNAQPLGARLRQARPDLGVFFEHSIGDKDSLRWRLGVERVLYEQSEDDFWRPEIELEWKHVWFPALVGTTTVGCFEELYDEDLSRDRRGFTTPSSEQLALRGTSLEEALVWKPAIWKKLAITARAGAAYESDSNGEYDEAARIWGSLITDVDLPWLDLSLIGRWQTTRYTFRQVDFFDTRRHRQNYRSLRFEGQRALPWNLSLKVAIEWEDFDSRISSEQFSERRVETLLSWSY